GSDEDKFVISDGSVVAKFHGQGIAVQGQLVHLRYQGSTLERIAFVKTLSIEMLLEGTPVKVQFETPTDGYLELEAGNKFERIYLDLSNQEGQETVVIETRKANPIRVTIPIGRETPL